MPTTFRRSLPLVLIASASSLAQVVQQPPAPQPPPATKLEGFSPKAGTVVTMGFDALGGVTKFGANGSIAVDVRQLTSGSDTVRGLVVTVMESQYRAENAFIDADEIPELIAGVDALLAVTTNPTPFSQFEQRYETKGELRLTAYSSTPGIRYQVRAGRVLTASLGTLTASDLQKLRGMFSAGQEKLASLSRK